MQGALIGLLLAPPPAAGELPPEPAPSTAERRTVVVERAPDAEGLARQRALDARSPGFATAIPIEPERGATPSDGLARVLSRAPGVRVRSLGGLGQFGAVQIRGSSAQQVQVFLDGVPLGDSFSGVVDLSSEPLDGLDRVEVYRGYIPIAFGGATLGGAVNLVAHAGQAEPSWVGSVGYGSFHTREARAGGSTPLADRPWTLGAQVSYAGSEGGFRFFDDGGTPRLRDDDTTTRRRNNDYDRVFGQLRLDGAPRGIDVSTQLRANHRDHGVPGTARVQSTRARQEITTLRSITRVGVARPRHAVTWVLGLTGGHRSYRDPLGQVGRGIDRERSWSFDGYLSPRLEVDLWAGAMLGLVAEVRGEVVAIDERDPPPDADILASGDATRSRITAAAGAELRQRLFGDIWTLVPALRVDLLDSHFAVPAGEGESGDEGRDETAAYASPRLGTTIALVKSAQLRGSIGRYLRAPTMFELFGDRGYVVGNEGLTPERGWAIDGGFVYDVTLRRATIYAQIAGFSTWTEDLIQFVRSGPVVRPINVEGAHQRGLESALSLRLLGRVLELDGSYTFLDSRNRTREAEQRNQPLPGRPRHEGNLRVAVGYPLGHGWTRFEPRLGYELDAVSEMALDPSGRFRLPARWLHAVVGELHWASGVHLGVEVRNLADLRTASIVPSAGPPDPIPVPLSDFIDYPLPGRSVFVRLTVDSHLLHDKKGT